MSIATTSEQEDLASSVRRWAQRHVPPQTLRACFEADGTARPDFWPALARQGLLGIHLDEAHGGSGGGLVELAVVCEELGRALAPGPVLPTMLGGWLLQRYAPARTAKERLPAIADGTSALAVSWAPDEVRASTSGDGWTLTGVCEHVLAAGQADALIVGATDENGDARWFLVDAGDPTVEVLDSLDNTRRIARVTLEDVQVGEDQLLTIPGPELVRHAACVVFGAEAAGIAGWCLDAATEYARTRAQFGVVIGEFQAIKHRCAQMLVEVEQAAALAWDAAVALSDDGQRPIASATVAAVAPEAAVWCAKECIQVHGGMGYTWEHDAHLYLRRATTLRQLLGDPATWRRRVSELTLAGERRVLGMDVGDGDGTREEIRALLEEAASLEGHEQRRFLADHGFLAPHWPRPWGRGAGAVEQLIIQQELRETAIKVPGLVMGDWVLPTIIAHGTEQQKQRFIRPTLYGELSWCQMFSEPGAGSDLAGLSTRAERVDGGWSLTGQKVWTSIAQFSDWSICLARTDPHAPKHEGITYFLVDMTTEGIDVRPLKEMTGHEMFNEVFLNDVFVPDDCVIGEVHHGWEYARTTLDSERVAIAEGPVMDSVLEDLIELTAAREGPPEPHVLDELGALLCEGTALALLGQRATARTLAGLTSKSTASVRKLVSAHHKQDAAELGLQLLGPAGATAVDAAANWTFQFLLTRSFTIFGGTSEIQRNLIGERILGLPRDSRTGDTGRA